MRSFFRPFAAGAAAVAALVFLAGAYYATANYMASGSDWEIGGTLNVQSGGKLTFNGVQPTGAVRAGAYTVTSGDDTANTTTIATGLSSISSVTVQVIRSNKVATSDAAITVSAGNLTVADGSTYVLTAGDVLRWVAVGA